MAGLPQPKAVSKGVAAEIARLQILQNRVLSEFLRDTGNVPRRKQGARTIGERR